MRKAGIALLIAGLILVIGGNFFFKTQANAVDSKTMTVNLSGAKSFRWPVYTGIIMLFVGGVFYMADRKNGKVEH